MTPKTLHYPTLTYVVVYKCLAIQSEGSQAEAKIKTYLQTNLKILGTRTSYLRGKWGLVARTRGLGIRTVSLMGLFLTHSSASLVLYGFFNSVLFLSFSIVHQGMHCAYSSLMHDIRVTRNI